MVVLAGLIALNDDQFTRTYKVNSFLVAQLKQWMEQRGCEVRIRDLFDAESIKHLEVHLWFGDLELGDGYLTMINSQEVDQLLEILDLLIGDLNGRLQSEYIALLLWLGLQQWLESSLTRRQLLKLLLVISLLLLGRQLSLHYSFATL